jgi:pre-rRNA-processing protein TSR4
MADHSWSDDDQEMSDVLLGVPDGNIDAHLDLIDAAVSRIGGLPVRAYCILGLITLF